MLFHVRYRKAVEVIIHSMFRGAALGGLLFYLDPELIVVGELTWEHIVVGAFREYTPLNYEFFMVTLRKLSPSRAEYIGTLFRPVFDKAKASNLTV